jgi:predicted nucleotide-binding protein
MRSCFAGIIHVASDDRIVGEDGKSRHKINDNVLIEIGAAMAPYKRNFILLVEDGLDLPTNLQGLVQCPYTGDSLDGTATMKLLKAINQFDGVQRRPSEPGALGGQGQRA